MKDKEISSGVWQMGSSSARNVVLLHGWGGTGPSNFGGVVDALEREFRVTLFDLAEHGKGTRTGRGSLNVEDLAGDVEGKLDDAGVNDAIFLGYSLGGAVAQQMWRDHPDRVRGLVLAATASRLSPTPVASAALRGWAATNVFSGPALGVVGAGVRTVLRLGANRWSTSNLSSATNHNWSAVHMLAGGVADFDSGEWIAQVDVPVSVLVCAGDRLVPTRRQLELARVTRAVHVVELGGGHLGFLRYPKLFSVALRELVRAVSSKSPSGG